MDEVEKMVSVIIPVYNTELYLRQCLDSILRQSYWAIEVILVDDGSLDSCPEICDDYALKDNRIKVLHKKNGGLSAARNAGLALATGKYVIFVDSDDYWATPEVLASLLRIFQDNNSLDFVNFNCIYFYQSDNLLKPWPIYPEAVLQGNNAQEVVPALIRNGIFPMSACMKLIKRKFLVDHHIWFREGIVSEDIPWFLEMLAKSRSFRFVNEYAYIYRKQVAGTISSSFSANKYNDLFMILCEETAKIQSNNSDSEYKKALLSFMAYEYCILLGMVNNFSGVERKRQNDKLRRYRWLLQYNMNPKVRRVKLLLRFVGTRLTSCILLFYINKFVNRN